MCCRLCYTRTPPTCFTPDSKLIAVGYPDGMVRFWELKTGTLNRTLDKHDTEVISLDISADGRLLAVGAEDGRIRLWDMKAGKLLRTLQGHRYHLPTKSD